MNNPSTLIIQFAKAPEPGSVKTRLSPVLTDEQRQGLHCAMTTWVCEQLHAVKGHFELWVAGSTNNPFVRQLQRRFKLAVFIQEGQDLGERMATAVSRGLRNYGQVFIVGSDCPFINPDYIKCGIKALHTHDIVIGPATDGGYVLLGIKEFDGDLFAGLPWGTDTVLAKTLTILAEKHYSVALLPAQPDIDRPDDLAVLDNTLLPEEIRRFARLAP